MIKSKIGQSTLEYILVVTVIIAAIIAFATMNNGMKEKVGNSLEHVTDQMSNVVNRLTY